MRRIIVVNAKGGCGKTTVATNLAASYAKRGLQTTLIDYDPQYSSLAWLKLRSSDLPRIHGVALHDGHGAPLAGAWQMRVPRETQRLIVDTPAGTRAADLVGRILPTDTLLVPLQPSAIDIRATADFVRDLLLVAKLRMQNRRLAIVVNRMRKEKGPLESLTRFLETLNIPVVERLRDSAHYVEAADQGCGIVDLQEPGAQDDARHWSTILDWLEDGVEEAPGPPQRGANVESIRPVVESAGPVARLVRSAPPPSATEALHVAEPRIPAFISKGWKDHTRH